MQMIISSHVCLQYTMWMIFKPIDVALNWYLLEWMMNLNNMNYNFLVFHSYIAYISINTRNLSNSIIKSYNLNENFYLYCCPIFHKFRIRLLSFKSLTSFCNKIYLILIYLGCLNGKLYELGLLVMLDQW